MESELMKQPVELKQGGAESSNQVVICKFTGCHDMSTVGLYCRLHYLMAWRKMKGKEARRKGKELNIYLKELAQKFPEDFLEKLKAELEEMSMKNQEADGDDDKGTLFEQAEAADEDLDTIIKGIRVEDF